MALVLARLGLGGGVRLGGALALRLRGALALGGFRLSRGAVGVRLGLLELRLRLRQALLLRLRLFDLFLALFLREEFGLFFAFAFLAFEFGGAFQC